MNIHDVFIRMVLLHLNINFC